MSGTSTIWLPASVCAVMRACFAAPAAEQNHFSPVNVKSRDETRPLLRRVRHPERKEVPCLRRQCCSFHLAGCSIPSYELKRVRVGFENSAKRKIGIS